MDGPCACGDQGTTYRSRGRKGSEHSMADELSGGINGVVTKEEEMRGRWWRDECRWRFLPGLECTLDGAQRWGGGRTRGGHGGESSLALQEKRERRKVEEGV